MWNILGIEPTKDIKAIKAAYAKLAKQYNPEEHPEEFKRIFDAYKSACAYARSKNTPEPQKPDTTQEGLNLSFAPKQEQSQSQGQTFYGYSWEYPEQILPGEQGAKVTHLQYMLSVISQFNSAVQEPPVSGVFGESTTQAAPSVVPRNGMRIP